MRPAFLFFFLAGNAVWKTLTVQNPYSVWGILTCQASNWKAPRAFGSWTAAQEGAVVSASPG